MGNIIYPRVLIQCNPPRYTGLVYIYPDKIDFHWGDGERIAVNEDLGAMMEALQTKGIYDEGFGVKAVVNYRGTPERTKLPASHRSLHLYERRTSNLFVCSYESLVEGLGLPVVVTERDIELAKILATYTK